MTKQCRPATVALLLAATLLVGGAEGDDGSCSAEEPSCRPVAPTSASAAAISTFTSSSSSSNAAAPQRPPALQLQCGLFLAESSIPNAGWGMYSGADLDEFVEILPFDVVIPVLDHAHHMDLYHAYVARPRKQRQRQHDGTHSDTNNTTTTESSSSNQQHMPRGGDSKKQQSKQHKQKLNKDDPNDLPPWLMAQYYWDSGMTHNWYDAEGIDSVIPGLGMLANSHPGMITAENMGPQRPSMLGAHGNGAASTYQDQYFQTLSPIPAGHEIFVEYGDEWFQDRFDETFGLSRDYRAANRLAERWQRIILDPYYNKPKNKRTKQKQQQMLMKTKPPKGNHYNAMIQDLRQLMLTTIQQFQPRLHSVLDRIPMIPPPADRGLPVANHKKRMISDKNQLAVPATMESTNNATAPQQQRPFQRLLANENPAAYASVPNAHRSMEWLYENGLCLDHVIVGNSTVVPGERGAFASRDLPRGTIVAPAPVVHMTREHLRMLIVSEFPDAHDNDDPILWQGYQLLLNYVFGHNESSLVFFPYSPAVNLINHYKPMTANFNAKQKESARWSRMGAGGGGDDDDGDKMKEPAPAPNVKLQWSKTMPHPEWLESWTTDQVLGEFMKAGLVMELVALTNIQQGDEILLDYGEIWETAFEQHLQSGYQPMELAPVDIHRHVLPTINDNPRTNGSGHDDVPAPLPSHVQTVCWIVPQQRPEYVGGQHQQEQQNKKPWAKWIPHTAMAYLSETVPCNIVGRNRDGAFYNVVVPREGVPEGVDPKMLPEETRIQNVPRHAIAIVPMPYTSPETRRGAFRHEIQLPDEMIPEHWRDLKQNEVGAPEPSKFDEPDELPEQGQCGLYMAESSIPQAGWGIFSGRAIETKSTRQGQSLSYGDIVILVEDFAQNQKLRKWFNNESMSVLSDTDDMDWSLALYTWRSDVTYGANLEADDIESVIPGLGMLANSHAALANAHLKSAQRTPTRTKDPSFGATSHYHNVRFLTKKKNKTMGADDVSRPSIIPGEEIFVDFGENQLMNGKRPLQSDYINADRALQRMEKLKKLNGDQIAAELWNVLWDSVDAFGQQRFNGTMPRDMNEAGTVLSQGGTAKYNLPNRIRSMEWLEKHGACLDNLRPGTSLIPMAGHGAFATRPIGEGSVIAPLPLAHVHRHHLEIYHSNNPDDPNENVSFVGHQQLLNYMYGHNESSLLLLPYSPVVNYINHAPPVSSNGDTASLTANAKLQWSSSFNTQDWLTRSPTDLLKTEKREGLVLELVATRAIAKDDEILIDYGPQWQEAWQDHLDNWEETFNDNGYVPAENDWLEWMPTKEEQEAVRASPFQPDFPSKVVGCHVRIPEKLPGGSRHKTTVTKPRQFNWRYSDGMFDNTRTVYPCEILERNIDCDDVMYALVRKESIAPLEDVYVALFNVTRTSADGKHHVDQHIVHNVPRRAVEFFDRKYTSPMFYRGAFRHEIGLPDHLVPAAWRDLKT